MYSLYLFWMIKLTNLDAWQRSENLSSNSIKFNGLRNVIKASIFEFKNNGKINHDFMP